MNHITGILLALISAGTWGTGDFFGGLTTRKYHPYAVLVVSAFAGITCLIICHYFFPEPFPSFPEFLWALLAGICGVVGLGALYQALALGHAALAAPTSAVIGASLPVLFNIVREGLPGMTKLAGFFLAFAGIWLVSRVPQEDSRISSRSLSLSILAGLGFGGFFIFITLAGPGLALTPLIISRSTFFVITGILLLIQRAPIRAASKDPLIWLTGAFDAGGNALYMLAKEFTRVDVAVVLSSLYPGITVILSRIFLKEHISRSQWVGVLISVSAVILITL